MHRRAVLADTGYGDRRVVRNITTLKGVIIRSRGATVVFVDKSTEE